MTLQQAPGIQPGALPRSGSFASSEVLPLIQQASHRLTELRGDWRELRDHAATAKADAKRIRAGLMVRLRVFGNEQTSGHPMKTAVERSEWADAEPAVQDAELAADLAQSASMDARAALDHAEEYFGTLRSMLGIERDDLQGQRQIPQ
jgi:hypothetical protein